MASNPHFAYDPAAVWEMYCQVLDKSPGLDIETAFRVVVKELYNIRILDKKIVYAGEYIKSLEDLLGAEKQKSGRLENELSGHKEQQKAYDALQKDVSDLRAELQNYKRETAETIRELSKARDGAQRLAADRLHDYNKLSRELKQMREEDDDPGLVRATQRGRIYLQRFDNGFSGFNNGDGNGDSERTSRLERDLMDERTKRENAENSAREASKPQRRLIAKADYSHVLFINGKQYGPYGRGFFEDRGEMLVYDEGNTYRVEGNVHNEKFTWNLPKKSFTICQEDYHN